MYDSMVIYRSFYEAIKDLDSATAGTIYNAIIGYGLNGEEPDLEGVAKSIFTLVKPQIDANNRRKENGAKGGQGRTKSEPNLNLDRTKPEPRPNLDRTKPEPNVNVNANVNANVVNNKSAPKRYADDDRLNNAIKDFIEHRRKLRKPMTDKAVELFIQRLNKFESSVDGQIRLINIAIERGWQTVYPAEDEKMPERKNNDKLKALEEYYMNGGEY